MNSAIDFTNKTFVVAGAGGIGAATAKTLNAYGARILLLDLNENNLNRTLLELKGEGNKTYICDFSAIHTIEPCVNSIIEENGLLCWSWCSASLKVVKIRIYAEGDEY